jgi:hypothetical protein
MGQIRSKVYYLTSININSHMNKLSFMSTNELDSTKTLDQADKTRTVNFVLNLLIPDIHGSSSIVSLSFQLASSVVLWCMRTGRKFAEQSTSN